MDGPLKGIITTLERSLENVSEDYYIIYVQIFDFTSGFFQVKSYRQARIHTVEFLIPF